jgi:hypothetical protein
MIEQISRIQVRTGKKDTLPEALAQSEPGFTTDTGELFIGAPDLEKIQWRRSLATSNESTNATGTFPYSNVKILTEFDVSYDLDGNIYQNGPLFSNSIPTSTIMSSVIIRLDIANAFDNYIIDYSLVLDNQSGVPPFPKRIGTLSIIHDNTNGSTLNGDTNIVLTDEYSELNGTINVLFGARVIEDTGTSYVELLLVNDDADTYRLNWSGKKWLSTPTT